MSQETSLYNVVVKFTFQSVFGNSRENPRHASAWGREESLELHSILWSDWWISKQNANVIFWRKRSDDWTYVCGLQASPNTAARKKRENLLFKPISRSHVTLSWSNPRTSFLLHFSKTHELRSLKATFTTAFFATVHHNYNHKQRTLKHRNTLNRSKSADHEPWRDLLNALK